MRLIKQLIEKAIERYNESKLLGEVDFEAYYFAVSLAYSWLSVKKGLKINDNVQKERENMFKYLYDGLINDSTSISRNKEELIKNYDDLKNKFKIRFNSFAEQDYFYISKFLDLYQEEKDYDEDTASVFFTSDSIAVLETNYPE